MNFYALIDNPFFILVVILLVFGAIAALVYFLRKYIPGFKDKEEKVSEEDAIVEELKRVLVEVDDEKIKAQLEQIKNEDDTKNK
jgi:Sec-independent protein translocase protein TatA